MALEPGGIAVMVPAKLRELQTHVKRPAPAIGGVEVLAFTQLAILRALHPRANAASVVQGTTTAFVTLLVSPLPSVTVSVTEYVPDTAHVFFVSGDTFVSLRPLPQFHA